jgi:ABC-type antimicrobial peptide transport system permease subunit
MLLNYLKIAFRNLGKDRLFSVLNIAGLCVGLAAGLLMLLWTQDELTFDNFHADADRIYREVAHFNSGESTESWAVTPAPHALFALQQVPEVEAAVRVCADDDRPIFRVDDVSRVEKKGAFADSSFFRVFKTEIISGNAERPFDGPESIVLTETFARRYFGRADVAGKNIGIGKDNVLVSAVIRDFPGNSVFQFEYLRNFELLKKSFEGNDMWRTLESDWGDFNYDTYLKLRPGASVATVEKKMTDIQHTNHPTDKESWYTLQALRDLHLVEADGSAPGMQAVRILGLAGLLLILIACINYMNLSTARASGRAREVGMRKVVGARKSQLLGQFMTETAVVFAIAAGMAVFAARLLLPYCNKIADKKLVLDFTRPDIAMLFGGVLLLTLLLSGLYPALVLSAFKPVDTLKGKLLGNTGSGTLRRGLVVTQFVFSIGLMISMLVIGRQLSFIRNKNLGYDRENIFSFGLAGEAWKHRKAMLDELAKQPGVTSVTSSGGNLLQSGSSTGDTDWEGKAPDQQMIVSPLSVAPEFISFFNMKLLAGEGFTGTQADSTRFILNEAAVREAGLKEPVVGKRFKLWQTDGVIAGVVRDFHFQSMRAKIGPAVLMSRPNRNGSIYIKTTGQDAARAVESAGAVWKKYERAYPFNYAFLDETFEKMYRREQRTSGLFNAFSGLAIFISCLGLFGLSAFTTARRFKEIGVRKVLGASVAEIIGLLAKDFLKLVVVALVVASPLAWYLMNDWLSDFAYRIEIQWWMFAAAGAAAIAIAFLTVGFQSMKAALTNPVKSLRSE